MFSARREGSNLPRGKWHIGMGEWCMDGGTRSQGSQLAMAGGDSE